MHFSLVALAWLAWHSMPKISEPKFSRSGTKRFKSKNCFQLEKVKFLTEIHDVVPADSTVIDNDVCKKNNEKVNLKKKRIGKIRV